VCEGGKGPTTSALAVSNLDDVAQLKDEKRYGGGKGRGGEGRGGEGTGTGRCVK